MNLIDRYIHAVGRYLPRKNRADIQAELRSALIDALDDRAEGQPTDEDVIAMLREFGPPKEVAASYYPEGQYLIGPTLYPLFRLVAGITLAAVLGAQMLAFSVAHFIANDPFSVLDVVTSLVNSIPTALGMVVIVFAILQWFDVRPDVEVKAWDPSQLPQIDTAQDISRTEHIISAGTGIVVLILLAVFADRIGFTIWPWGEFLANPVIGRYLGWIYLSITVNIVLDIYLLWQGRWGTNARLAKIAASLLSIAVLAVLYQQHTLWLRERGAVSFITAVERFEESVSAGTQLLGMHAFRIAFGVALIVTILETLVAIYRLLRSAVRNRDLSRPIIA